HDFVLEHLSHVGDETSNITPAHVALYDDAPFGPLALNRGGPLDKLNLRHRGERHSRARLRIDQRLAHLRRRASDVITPSQDQVESSLPVDDFPHLARAERFDEI